MDTKQHKELLSKNAQLKIDAVAKNLDQNMHILMDACMPEIQNEEWLSFLSRVIILSDVKVMYLKRGIGLCVLIQIAMTLMSWYQSVQL